MTYTEIFGENERSKGTTFHDQPTHPLHSRVYVLMPT